jgi:hypothetical protein
VAAQKTTAETLRQAFGGLDILFINASIVDSKPQAVRRTDIARHSSKCGQPWPDFTKRQRI